MKEKIFKRTYLVKTLTIIFSIFTFLFIEGVYASEVEKFHISTEAELNINEQIEVLLTVTPNNEDLTIIGIDSNDTDVLEITDYMINFVAEADTIYNFTIEYEEVTARGWNWTDTRFDEITYEYSISSNEANSLIKDAEGLFDEEDFGNIDEDYYEKEHVVEENEVEQNFNEFETEQLAEEMSFEEIESYKIAQEQIVEDVEIEHITVLSNANNPYTINGTTYPTFTDFKNALKTASGEVTISGQLDTPTGLNKLFYRNKNVTSVIFDNFDASVANTTYQMFNEASNITSITFGDTFNTSNVINMSYMFAYTPKLTNINFGNSFDTSKVMNMSRMFFGTEKLTTLDLSKFNTTSATDMSYMFYDIGVETLDLSSFDTRVSATNPYGLMNARYMFADTAKLSNIIYGPNFDTSKVTDMSHIFYGAKGFETLDLSAFDTSSVKDMQYMFSATAKLSHINFGNTFDTSNVTNMSYMFYQANGFETIDLSAFNTSSVKDMQYMFATTQNLSHINFGNTFDTSNVTTMYGMFSNADGFVTLDLSAFNTSSVKDMMKMFANTEKLSSINFGNTFDTSNVTNMSYMFNDAKGFETLDLSAFNTSSVTDMKNMFAYTTKLSNINFGNTFDTSNVTNMSYMFYESEGFETLDLSALNTSSVTDMKYMFAYTDKLSSIDFGTNFNTSNVTNMSFMFKEAEGFEKLELPFNTSNVTDMKSMFLNMNSLIYLDISSFDISRVSTSNMSNFLGTTNKLEYIELPATIGASTTFSSYITTKNNPLYLYTKDATLDGNLDLATVMPDSITVQHQGLIYAVENPVVTWSNIEEYTYDGLEKTPTPTITVRYILDDLVAGRDYELAYANNINAGDASITVKYIGDFGVKNDATKTFKINKVDLQWDTTNVSVADKNHDGTTNATITTKPTLTGFVNNDTVAGLGITVTSVANFKDSNLGSDKEVEVVSTASGTLTNYNLPLESRVTVFADIIANEIILTDVKVEVDDELCVYTGQLVEPQVTVTSDTYNLVKDVDYTLTFTNNISASENANVLVAFIGTFDKSDDIAQTFTIKPKDATGTNVDTEHPSYTYTSHEIIPKLNPIVIDGLTLVEGIDYTVSYTNNINVKDEPKVEVTYKGNYTGLSEKESAFDITAINVDGGILEIKDQYYTGSAIESRILKVKTLTEEIELNYVYENGIASGDLKSIKYTNNVNIGQANVEVEFDGNLSGKATGVFNILVKKKPTSGNNSYSGIDKEYKGPSAFVKQEEDKEEVEDEVVDNEIVHWIVDNYEKEREIAKVLIDGKEVQGYYQENGLLYIAHSDIKKFELGQHIMEVFIDEEIIELNIMIDEEKISVIDPKPEPEIEEPEIVIVEEPCNFPWWIIFVILAGTLTIIAIYVKRKENKNNKE